MSDARNWTIKPEFQLSLDNFVHLYDVISLYSNETAIEQCLAFLDANAEQLVNAESVFTRLPHSVVEKLVTRKTFKVKEWKKCKALIQWQKRNAVFDVMELVKPLQWDKISVAEFKSHILTLNAITATQFFELVPSNSNDSDSFGTKSNGTPDRDCTPLSDVEEPSTPSSDTRKRAAAKIKQEKNWSTSLTITSVNNENGSTEIKHELSPMAGPSNNEQYYDLMDDEEEEYEEDDVEYYGGYGGEIPVMAFLKQELVTDDLSDSENNNSTRQINRAKKRSADASNNNGDNFESETPTSGRKRRTIWYNENTIKHLREEVSENGLKLYGCSICDKQFGQGNSALRHIAVVHFNAKQFSCDVCGKFFSQMSNLKQHIDSIHVADYSYVCEIANCGRRFKSNNQLNQHRKVVHEKREFCQCEICHRPFHTRKGLMTHKKTKHETLMPLL